jgi:hypothetical protein
LAAFAETTEFGRVPHLRKNENSRIAGLFSNCAERRRASLESHLICRVTTELYRKFVFAPADDRQFPLMICPIWTIFDLFNKRQLSRHFY